ncbi:CPXCG motif-containing cysteine-rich protein [Methylicorpusculum oleiharenae]|uniref:CPXCG motif-containing cysteine-rich protein n=1 Tax=Methylicorpusculum oleiharenae TaxID=1338687 RepID=UPI001359B726|nr:CPXCG motif-containing cysteine-rich protein [Methylicorpusculum oleiharenae]MCD2449718.1 CPXCG motif-containing cysteine-rich protein [Methylicorpusculum oleiharenae]
MSLLDECLIDCPHCGENISILIDTSVDYQDYYEDCPVCCSPILLLISCNGDSVDVVIKSDNE